jgi:general secretion pathway protein H
MLSGRRENISGFTLIEILIVLVIIGITIALISVNFARDERAELNETAKRLALILQAANNEAIASGKSLAFIGNTSAYAFYNRNSERQWSKPITETPFAENRLPSSTSIVDLQIDETRVPIATPLIFSSSGFNPSFRIELASSDIRLAVVGESSGNIYVRDNVAVPEK